MTISMYIKMTIPIVGESFRNIPWFVDEMGSAACYYNDSMYCLFRWNPFRTKEMVKRLVEIHNENLFIGMSDDEYNKHI